MEEKNILPIAFKVIENTIGWELTGFNAETGRFTHSLKDGGADYTDEEMAELNSQFTKMFMNATKSKTKEELVGKFADFEKYLNEHNLSIGDGFFTHYNAWQTDKMPFSCKICSHGHCMLELSRGERPSCDAYEEREKWINGEYKTEENNVDCKR